MQRKEKWLLPEKLEKALESELASVLTEPGRMGDGIPSGRGWKCLLDRGNPKSKGMK